MFFLKTRNPVKDKNGNTYRFMKTFLTTTDEINNFFKSRVLTNKALQDGEDGIYSFIYKENMFSAIPLYSAQEIGTLHVNLDMYTDDEIPTIAAGELIKDGTRILYNLRSGSYMEKKIKSKKIRDELIHDITTALEMLNFEPVFLDCDNTTEYICDQPYETYSGYSIIEKKDIVTSKKEIEIYKKFFTIDDDKEDTLEGGRRKKKATRRRKN